jgi:hypothetical protein
MKRALSLVLVAGVAFSLGHFQRGPTHLAGALGGAVPLSGDANADGKVDISDGIYIISYQFRGGPAPVPIVCPPTGLAATGQKKCYDNAGHEIDCASVDFPGQDGFYQTGCPHEGRFTDHLDGTVTDNCTGLMWQKATADVNGDGQIGEELDGGDRLVWQDALKYCEDLRFADHDDWRLPNVRELQSIVDYGRVRPSVDPVFQAVWNWYGASSSSAIRSDFAWLVHFGDGVSAYVPDKGGRWFVRAVRNAP